ncbi:MAG: DUF1298 domain-containing protein, partial [Anaerolineae bacterium]|nr:DUF1298 domain-containing protein [Anaerolineae bacterium]
NIGALTIYEGHIDFRAFVQLIDSRLHVAPRYFQRIVQAPFRLGQPTWIADPSFYIHNHVKRVVLAAPASEEQLRTKVGELLSRTLDRSKPLWEIYLIEGLAASTAIFFKVHHCMVDGLAAVDLVNILMEFDSGVQPAQEKPVFSAARLPDPATLTRDSLQRDLLHRFNLLDKMGKDITRVASNLLDSNQRLKMFIGVAHLLNNSLRPIRRLPINGTNSGRQRLIWGAFPLEEIHSIRGKVGASVNDVMLSVMTDAVERYCRRRHMNDQAFLRILVPFNVRAEEEIGNYGNRIAVLPIDVPFGVDGPLERLQATTKFSKAMKDSSLSLTMDMILTLPSLLPAAVQPSIWGVAPLAFSILAHTWCTNVAAPPTPVYLLGHELKQVYGYFPLNPTMGVAGVIVSYNRQITLTLVVDEAIIPDPQTLEDDLREAYAQLRHAAGLPVSVVPSPAAEEPLVTSHVNGVLPDSAPAPIVNTSATESKSDEPATTQAQAEARPTPESEAESLPDEVMTVEKSEVTMTGASPAISKSPNGSVPQPTTYKLFSEAWAKAFREVINQSDEYRRAGANWTAGSLVFTMNAAPAHDFPQPASVYLSLHRGECRDAHAINSYDAKQQGDFIIAGDYAAWMEVLSGRTSPLIMLTTGRLILRKGSLLKLLPHTRSATELVNCARRVPRS